MLSPPPNEDAFASVLSMPGLRWSPSLRDQVKDRLNRGVWRDELIRRAEHILRRTLREYRISEDAEDILQEYNAKRLDRHLDTFDPAKGRFEAFLPRWFGGFCLDQAKVLFRQRSREVGIVEDTPPTAAKDAGAPKGIILIAPPSCGPEERQRYQELLDFIRACLTEKELQLIWLHDTSGYTFEEIASMLGTTEGAARVMYHRAKRKLRQRLRDEGYLD